MDIQQNKTYWNVFTDKKITVILPYFNKDAVVYVCHSEEGAQCIMTAKHKFFVEEFTDIEPVIWPPKEGQKVYIVDALGHTLGLTYKGDLFMSKIYPTNEAAEKAFKKQELLYEIQAVADELNGGWKPDLNDRDQKKYSVSYNQCSKNLDMYNPVNNLVNKIGINTIWFKNYREGVKTLEKFGDRIKELLL